MEVTKFHPQESGALKGFMDLELPKLGWTLVGCKLFESKGSRWVNLPDKEFTDAEGKKGYAPTIRMDKEKKEAFSSAALDALDRYFQQESGQVSDALPF